MSRPLAIANGLNLQAFVVFDGDCDREKLNEQERDNACLISLLEEECTPIIENTFFGNRTVMWCTRILDSISDEVGEEEWNAAEEQSRQTYNLQAGVRRKNPVLITATVEHLLIKGIEIPLLDKLCQNLISFAENHVSPSRNAP